jgi:hypothetical protein
MRTVSNIAESRRRRITACTQTNTFYPAGAGAKLRCDGAIGTKSDEKRPIDLGMVRRSEPGVNRRRRDARPSNEALAPPE